MRIETTFVSFNEATKEVTLCSTMYLNVNDWGYDKLPEKAIAFKGKLLNSVLVVKKISFAGNFSSTDSQEQPERTQQEDIKDRLVLDFQTRLKDPVDTCFMQLKEAVDGKILLQ